LAGEKEGGGGGKELPGDELRFCNLRCTHEWAAYPVACTHSITLLPLPSPLPLSIFDVSRHVIREGLGGGVDLGGNVELFLLWSFLSGCSLLTHQISALGRQGKRRELFLSAGANSLDDIRCKTEEMLESDRLKTFFLSRPAYKYFDLPAKVCESIVKEVEEWLERYKKRDAEWFNDEFQYSKAMRELSEVERLATGKMDYYLETGDVNTKDVPMEQVARYAEADMVRRLDSMVERSKAEGGREGIADAESEARRELALDLCRRRGLVIKSVDETNDLGEPPLVASGARGDVENLDLLLVAGCNLKLDSATKGGSPATALHMACMMGHLEYARRLVADELGAGLLLLRQDRLGRTGLYHAAERGHQRVVKLMLEKGGKELGMVVTLGETSCAQIAAQNGHLDVLRLLHEACGKNLLMLVEKDGSSCAFVAAMNGHSDVLRWLYETCGRDVLMLVQKDGTSCAWIAAQNGHLNVLRLLYEVCGKDLLMLVREDGASCAFVAAMNGHLDVLRWLKDVCGK
jgi:hypothetical protein